MVKRYDMESTWTGASMELAKDGDFVAYEDYASLRDALRMTRDALELVKLDLGGDVSFPDTTVEFAITAANALLDKE